MKISLLRKAKELYSSFRNYDEDPFFHVLFVLKEERKRNFSLSATCAQPRESGTVLISRSLSEPHHQLRRSGSSNPTVSKSRVFSRKLVKRGVFWPGQKYAVDFVRRPGHTLCTFKYRSPLWVARMALSSPAPRSGLGITSRAERPSFLIVGLLWK